MDASSKFTKVATTFHNSFDITIPSLELLSYHEYNDQLLELERAFLLPPGSSSKFSSSGIAALDNTDEDVSDVSTSTYRHVIHGPSPLGTIHILSKHIFGFFFDPSTHLVSKHKIFTRPTLSIT